MIVFYYFYEKSGHPKFYQPVVGMMRTAHHGCMERSPFISSSTLSRTDWKRLSRRLVMDLISLPVLATTVTSILNPVMLTMTLHAWHSSLFGIVLVGTVLTIHFSKRLLRSFKSRFPLQPLFHSKSIWTTVRLT